MKNRLDIDLEKQYWMAEKKSAGPDYSMSGADFFFKKNPIFL